MTDFVEPAEYAELRAAVRDITAGYGLGDYAEHAKTSTPQTELWAELGKAGFIGINVPERFGGGGAGMSELAVVAEESAAAGCPLLLLLVSSAISVEVLSRHGSQAQQERWLTADGRRVDQDGLRHHRAGRRIELAPDRHHRPPRRRRLPDLRQQVLHLRGRRVRGDPDRRRHRQSIR